MTVGTAAVALATASSASTGYVATSSSGCPSTHVSVPNKDDFTSNASNTTFDARGTAWDQKAGVSDYSVKLNASGGSGNCYMGGSITGTNSITGKTWSNLKSCCNGAAFMPYTSASFFNVRADNIAVDDFRMLNKGPSSNYDGNNSYYVGGSYLTNTRDDCFSTAHAALTVNDTLAECYSIVSWRHTGNDNTPFPVTLSNDLLYLKPQLSGSESNCPSQMNGGYGSGQIWKMDSFTGSSSLINVSNTIFRADQGNDMACTLAWANGTFTNDTMVWTGKGSYPGKLPAGVKLTTDKSVWDNAVSQWKCNHGYTCSSGTPSPSPSPTTSPATSPSPSPSPTVSPTTSPSSSPSSSTHPITKVLTIWLENHSMSQEMSGMPYLASMSKTYGYTTNYKAIAHPSLPNYLAFAAGSTLGVTDDNPPSSHKLTGTTLFSQAIGAGKTAKTYAENMMDSSGTPQNCETNDIVTPTGYEVHHNVWTYFTDDRTNCGKFDVPFPGNTSGGANTSTGALKNDVTNGLPDFSWVVPNECNDGHDCGLSVADNWLKSWLPVIMAGKDYQAGKLAIVVTTDEDDRQSGNLVLTTVISPYTHGVVSNTAYTHYSLTRLVDDVLGLPDLRNAANANGMRGAFHL